ncbi:MAG: cell wall hydrolase [Firmicutes bacterium]|nr:cell wall hydrolase [Bacillota bacterium]
MGKFVSRLAVKLVVFAVAMFVFSGANAAASEPAQSLDLETVSHTVRDGDTLYGIAREYQVQLQDLMRANNLNGTLIRPRETLVIPEKNIDGKQISRGNITREELMLLAKLIHAEARGESFEGKVAVGAVILNRLASPHFPKTISEIVYQKNSRVYQFSPVADGSINLEPDESAVRAAKEALMGKDPTGGALFFYNPDLSRDRWIRTLPVIIRIGNHVFATSS